MLCLVPSPSFMQIRASDGAMDEFTKAFDTYKDAIFRHCYFHVFDRERARELLQETFLKTWEYLAAGKDIENVQAFLYRVATNLCYNEIRRKKEVSLDALQEAGFDPGQDDEKLKRDPIAEEQVLAVLKKVEEPYRTALSLRFIEGYSPAEIAAITGETANAISVRLHRGLTHLRQLVPHG